MTGRNRGSKNTAPGRHSIDAKCLSLVFVCISVRKLTLPTGYQHGKNQSCTKTFVIQRLLETTHYRRTQRAIREAWEVQRSLHLAPSRQRRRVVFGREGPVSDGPSRRRPGKGG